MPNKDNAAVGEAISRKITRREAAKSGVAFTPAPKPSQKGRARKAIAGEVVEAPEFTVRHPAGDLVGAEAGDPQFLMCAACGAIGGHTDECPANAKALTPEIALPASFTPAPEVEKTPAEIRHDFMLAKWARERAERAVERISGAIGDAKTGDEKRSLSQELKAARSVLSERKTAEAKAKATRDALRAK